jgi:hypothetical protein
MDVTKPYKFIGDIHGPKPYKFIGFWAGRASSISGIWAAPAAPKTMPKGGELRPPPFGMVLGAAGAAQTPEIGD